jgi:hypothetical protein
MLEDGEVIADLVGREVMEETGLLVRLHDDTAPFEIPGVLAVTDHLDPGNGQHGLAPHLTLWVLTHWVSGKPEANEPDKCDSWTWYGPHDLMHLLTEEGGDDQGSEQHYWTPLPLWRRILRPYLDLGSLCRDPHH